MVINIRHKARIVSMIGCLFAAPGSAQDAQSVSPKATLIPLFVINYRAGPNWRRGVPMRDQGLRDHFYYWKSLDERGIVAVAGAVGDDAGLVLLHVTSQREAERVIADDPAFKAGIFLGEARPYFPRFVGRVPIVPMRP